MSHCFQALSFFFLLASNRVRLSLSLSPDPDPDLNKIDGGTKPPPAFLRWPHMQADQVRGLCLREIGGGFSRHHRAPSIRAACYAIAKPSTMVQKMQHIKKLRGHLSAVYCGKLPCLLACFFFFF